MHDIRNIIGGKIKNVLLKFFYLEENYISTVGLYIIIDNIFYGINCCEENVFIRAQKEIPQDLDEGEFYYKLQEQNIEWLQHNRVVSIKYLIDPMCIKRGVIFFFDNHHNLLYFNKGYEFKDEEILEIDINVKSLLYNLVDV